MESIFPTNISTNHRTRNIKKKSIARKFLSVSRKREKLVGGIVLEICLLETSPHGIFRRGRFAFNRDPRPTYTAACVPSRYEFIVYTERPPVHIRKLIVQAVNYSACTPATAAAVPHVYKPCSTRISVFRDVPCIGIGKK